MPTIRRAVRTDHSFSVMMSGKVRSRDVRRQADLDGGDLWIAQCPAYSHDTVDHHRQHHRDEQRGQCGVDVIVDDDAVHLRQRLRRRQDLARHGGVAEHPRMSNEADRRFDAKDFLQPRRQRAYQEP